MRITEQQLEEFMNVNSSDGTRDDITHLTTNISIGLVVNADDPLESGRLMVFCPEFNDNPKKIHHLPWALYGSPFGGSVNNSGYARGHQKGKESTTGAVHYGFWGIPEQGAHVLIACINDDPRRRVWLGCIPEHQETHTIGTGRYDWSGGFPDGPLSSTKDPIEPAYSNATEAFQDKKDTPEWKTRSANYQITGVREDIGEIPNPSRGSYLDNQYPQISEAESDDWVKPILGAHGYDWSGHKNLGAFKSSRVYSWSSPGFHSMMMDDRAFNSRIQFKTTAGHQIILDDTNERIYISTYEGKSYIEMDKSGNIDIYADRRLSIHAKKDINIESDETVRIKGKKGIHMYSGDTRGQKSLDVVPEDGQIRMHAVNDIHVMTEKSLRTLSVEDTFFEVGRDMCTSVGGVYSLQVEGDLNTIVNKGDLSTSINGSLLINATANISQFAGHSAKHRAINNTEIFSFRGKMDLAAQMDVNIKSKGENVAIESVKESVTLSGDGENSMFTVATNIDSVSNNNVTASAQNQIAQTASTEVSVEKAKNDPPGCFEFPGVTVKLTNDGLEEHEGDLDVTFKLPDGVERTVNDMNEFMEDMEEDWNNHMQLFHEHVNSINASLTKMLTLEFLEVPLPPWLGALPISFSLELPAIELPTLNLPNLCFDLTNILTIEGLELLPDSLFELNVDLGGWTKDNIMGWVNGLKGEVSKLKNSFDSALTQVGGIQGQIDNVLSQFTNAVENINLLSINFTNPTGTDSDVLYANYNINIGDAINALNTYNSTVTGEGLPSVISMMSELASHVDSNNTILSNIVSGGLDSSDLIALADSAMTLEGYVTDLGGGI